MKGTSLKKGNLDPSNTDKAGISYHPHYDTLKVPFQWFIVWQNKLSCKWEPRDSMNILKVNGVQTVRHFYVFGLPLVVSIEMGDRVHTFLWKSTKVVDREIQWGCKFKKSTSYLYLVWVTWKNLRLSVLGSSIMLLTTKYCY